MPGSRRLSKILDSSSSDIIDNAGDSTLPASRGKPKLVRLAALLFGSKKTKPSASVGRGAVSLDICLNSERCRQDGRPNASAQGVALTAPPRQSESRILAFLGSRLSDGSALGPSRTSPDESSSSSTATAFTEAPPHTQSSQCQQNAAAAAATPPSPGSSSTGGATSSASASSFTSPAAKPGPRSPNSVRALDPSEPLEAAPGPEPMSYHDTETAADVDSYSVQVQRPVTSAHPAGVDAVGGSRAVATPRGVVTLRAHVEAEAAAAAAETAAAAAAASAAASLPRRHTQLLACCSAAPEAMRRPCWCLEDYAVDRKLYRSNTASVYSALCLRSGQPVALKVFNLARVPANVVHMLIREIKIQLALVHKNIAMLYGAFQDLASQRLVLVQEFAANGDLLAVHRSLRRRMSEGQARSLVLRPLLEAVAHFHSQGIVHRDIKPDNLLFTSDWRLLVGDFGVAIDTTQERAVTRAGTVGYMAPEVERCPLKMQPEDNKWDPSLAYTTAADIWGIGCLTYLLLLGFPPFIEGSGGNNHSSSNLADSDGGDAGSGRALIFPASTSLRARDFISSALAERPEERPTARQLLQHPWMQLQQQ
ncbi:hypothetical protein PLESTF_000551000 [Pleodorina starrii]|nr:hypothetical protein PLESTF_000551000 [Pleodorina starrii]